MIDIDQALINKAVDEMILYKKEGHEWEKAIRFLYDVDPFFDELAENPQTLKEYKSVSAFILEEAKKKLALENAGSKGIAVRKELWCFPGYLEHPFYWSKFKIMMSGWSEARWKTVEKQTFEMVNYLTNPLAKLDSHSDSTVKGLVYGNVQSGKTAHIASLIALYASMGCPLTIVFSGVTKSLRAQTEDRLRHDLGIDEWGTFDLITAETDLLSKKTPRIEGKMYGNFKPIIGVFKKSPAALSRLHKYLTNTNDIDFWKGRQILIIDDECDQYSPNTKTIYTDQEDIDYDRSTVNSLLVSILNVFDRYCYVGYTATPFANILNELPGPNSIYPKDFIYPLEQNSKYYGAKKIFGSINDDPEKDSEVLKAIVNIDAKDINPKFNSYDSLSDSIKDAVYYFITATACKYYRNMDKEHSSMLFHIDLKKNTHAIAAKAITEFLSKEVRPYTQETRQKLKEVWESSKDRINIDTVRKLFDYTKEETKSYVRPKFEDIEYYVKQVINKLEVIIDNSDIKKEDRLSYPNDHSVVYIVIGGNTLSRGLTLEGLLVSIFFRTSSLYDTLLQMGRWFGYRIGYEDLVRVYTTSKIVSKYQELVVVEEDLREEFEKYSLDVTPSQVSTRIRKMPSLQITRKKAMQSAISTGINYSGFRPSTLFFPHFDRDWLKHNIDTTISFLESLKGSPIMKNGVFMFTDIPLETIRNYVVAMNIHKNNQACNKDLILKFLDKAKDKNYIKKWNVVIANNINDTNGKLKLRHDITANLVARSRINRKNDQEETVYIKVLQQPNNMFWDTDICDLIPDNTPIREKFIKRHEYFEEKGEAEPGLMVIYPISKDSTPNNYDPKADDNYRIPLDTPEHVIGLMFTFPSSKDIELDEYMTIDLPTEIEEDDDEE